MKKSKKISKVKLSADEADKAAEAIVRAFYLYPHYHVDSRGPAGCLVSVLRLVAPRVAAELQKEDAHSVYARRWGES